MYLCCHGQHRVHQTTEVPYEYALERRRGRRRRERRNERREEREIEGVERERGEGKERGR